MAHPRLIGLALLTLAGLAAPLAATHPQVSAITPRGARQGSELTLTIYGQGLQGIQGLMLFGPGIEVLSLKSENARRAQVRIRIAKDCPLGRHPMLVRTRRGLSKLHLFFVGTLRELKEAEPNNDHAKAQLVPLESTINGRITNQDVDVFAIDVKQGQQIHIEVQGLRLGDQEFDSHLTVEDANGRRLLQVDDTIYTHLDPMCSLRCETSGRWFLSLRENARGGTNQSFYRLHVGTFPRPLITFPAGGQVGRETAVQFLGQGESRAGSIAMPAAGIHKHFARTPLGTSPSPLRFASSPHPNQFERKTGQQTKACQLGQWSLIGPFANPRDPRGASLGHRRSYPPEQGFSTAAAYPGRDGKVSWTRPKNLRDSSVMDLSRWVARTDHSVVYLHREITAATARRVLCMLSGDDTIRAWCNGKLVLDDGKPSGTSKDQHRLFLRLRQGRNDLLVKLSNRGGKLGFYCRLLDPHRLVDHTVVEFPSALNGILEKPLELDRFVFLAKAKQAIDFTVIARQLRSPIDPITAIYCSHQRFYAGNDDSGGMDSRLRFRAPFTGEFVFRIGDLLQTGSPYHVYRIEAAPPQRATLVSRIALPGYVYEWCVELPQGGRNAMMIATTNLDRRAGTKLTIKGLPTGVSAKIPAFASGATTVPVVFQADAKTTTQGRLLDIAATATVKGRKVTGARFRQTVPIVQARNRRTYLSSQINRLPLAVTLAAPLAISVARLTVPLVRSSSLLIPIDVRWSKGSKASARVRMLYKPPGISSAEVTIKPGQKRAYLRLYASSSAATRVHKIVLVGAVSIDGAKISVSTDLVDLLVSRPWIEASLGKVRSTPGNTVQLDITVAHPKKFRGRIETSWVGLPRDIACAAVIIEPDTTKLTIPVRIGPKAPPGRHRGFRLRLQLHSAEGIVTHDFRSGEIRVDRPIPVRNRPR